MAKFSKRIARRAVSCAVIAACFGLPGAQGVQAASTTIKVRLSVTPPLICRHDLTPAGNASFEVDEFCNALLGYQLKLDLDPAARGAVKSVSYGGQRIELGDDDGPVTLRAITRAHYGTYRLSFELADPAGTIAPEQVALSYDVVDG